jgi:hypothetical protein
MKGEHFNQKALEGLRAKISQQQVVEAFDRLTAFGIESPALSAGPGGKGRNADFRYLSSEPGGWPFSITTTQAHLLFHVRPLALQVLGLTRAALAANFAGARKPARGGLQIIIRSCADADAVVDQLLSRWPVAGAAKPAASAQGSPEILHAVDVLQRDIWERRDIGIAEKRALLGARLGHGVYRANVEQVDGACRVTGVMDRRHLRATHIKPWRDCTDTEKLDGHNGVMLSPHVAHLFERGYITFSDSGDLLVSGTLNSRVLKQWGIAVPIPPRPFSPKQKAYLAWHRQHVYEKVETGRRRKTSG